MRDTGDENQPRKEVWSLKIRLREEGVGFGPAALCQEALQYIEQLEAALQTLCYHWDQMLNNLDDGEEFEAREAARAALGQEKAE